MHLRNQGLGIEQSKNMEIDFRWHMRKEGGSKVMPIHYWTEQLQWYIEGKAYMEKMSLI